MTQEKQKALKVLDILKDHKEQITTARNWERYAKKHSLPSSSSLIKIFGSWNALKEKMNLEKRLNYYDKNELLDIALLHSERFTTIKEWDKYAHLKGLPTSQTYIKHFYSWVEIKNKLNLQPSLRSSKYTMDQIRKIIKEHGAYLDSRSKWDEYAKEHKLPSYLTLVKYYSWPEIKKMAGKPLKYNYTDDDLKRIARQHIKNFTSMNYWDKYAKKISLPLSSTYSRRFGSWNKAKFKCLY